MPALNRRLERLEGVAKHRPSAQEEERRGKVAEAARQLFDALDVALPNGPWAPNPDDGPWLTTLGRVAALGERLAAGTATAEDAAVLAQLPRDALAVFPLTPEQFVEALMNLHTET